MNTYVKGVVASSIFLVSIFLAPNVFAQTQHFQDLSINTTTKMLTGTITSTQAGREIDIMVWNPVTEFNEAIAFFPWQQGSVSSSLQQYTLTNSTITSLSGDVYTQIKIAPSFPQEGEFEIVLNISDITTTGGGQMQSDPQSEVFVNFPGWSMAVYQQTPSGQYYPYIKSNGSLDRTPASETLYLMLENKSTGQVSVLDTYPGGASSFYITWPPSVPSSGTLTPGGSYAIFLSDNQVDRVLYAGANTYYDIPGVVPGGGSLEEEVPIPEEDDPGQGSGGTTIDPGGSTGITYTPLQREILDGGLVPTDCGYNLGRGEGGRICGFSDMIKLVERVIEYIFILVLPILAIVIAYAGYLYIISAGNSSKRTAAKNAITKALIGVLIVMSAWLIVKTIVVSLGVDTGASWFYLSI